MASETRRRRVAVLVASLVLCLALVAAAAAQQVPEAAREGVGSEAEETLAPALQSPPVEERPLPSPAPAQPAVSEAPVRPPAAGEPAAAPEALPETAEAPLPAATIVLDAGHGGQDTGLVGPGGTREKTVTLKLARELQEELQTRYGLRVVLTREADYAMSNEERAARANSLGASLYLSLHMKGGLTANVEGTDIIVAPPPEAEVSRSSGETAAAGSSRTLEVKVGKDVLRLQPWEQLQTSAAQQSRRLAAALRGAIRSVNPFYPVRVLELPVVQLVGIQAPAVLVEAVALVNPAEEVKVQNSEFLRELARTLAAGIIQSLEPQS